MLFRRKKKRIDKVEKQPAFGKQCYNVLPELDTTLESLNDEQLIEIGYVLIYEAMLLLRRFDPRFDYNNSLAFWVREISDSLHNIPVKLQKKDTKFLKEEIETAITILYNFETIEKGKLSRHSCINCLPHLNYNSDTKQNEFTREVI